MSNDYRDILVVKTDFDDDVILAAAPGCMADIGDRVELVGGGLGVVIQRKFDPGSDIRDIATYFTAVKVVKSIWQKIWDREVEKGD